MCETASDTIALSHRIAINLFLYELSACICFAKAVCENSRLKSSKFVAEKCVEGSLSRVHFTVEIL